MAKILIVGCGYVGNQLAVELMARGHAVTGLRRNANAVANRAASISADLTQPESLAVLDSDFDFVYFTVAPDRSDDASYSATYVDGLFNLIDVLSRIGGEPSRLFVVSSTAVYAQSNGEWVDEQSDTEPIRFSGQRMLQLEALAFGAPIEHTVVRFGGIYGPGRTRFIEQVRNGEASMPRETVYTNRIHRDDCAGVLAHLMEVPEPRPLYIGVDQDPADKREVLTWLAKKLGAPKPKPAEEAAVTTNNKRCSSRRIVESGYKFKYPDYRAGYSSILEENEIDV